MQNDDWNTYYTLYIINDNFKNSIPGINEMYDEALYEGKTIKERMNKERSNTYINHHRDVSPLFVRLKSEYQNYMLKKGDNKYIIENVIRKRLTSKSKNDQDYWLDLNTYKIFFNPMGSKCFGMKYDKATK